MLTFLHKKSSSYCAKCQTTLNALEFFYPRLNVGGIIVTHDYDASGVWRAFDKFCSKNKLKVIELAGTSQAIIIKVNK